MSLVNDNKKLYTNDRFSKLSEKINQIRTVKKYMFNLSLSLVLLIAIH